MVSKTNTSNCTSRKSLQPDKTLITCLGYERGYEWYIEQGKIHVTGAKNLIKTTIMAILTLKKVRRRMYVEKKKNK